MTSCEEPYIGEESIRRPPSSKKARMISAHESRAAASSPTLNVIQLPSPTGGSASPLEGIARVPIAPEALPDNGLARTRQGRRIEAPAATPRARRTSRRDGAI